MRMRRGKVVSFIAGRKTKPSKRTLILGKKAAQFRAGHPRLARIKLNVIGRRLLKTHGRLSIRLGVSQVMNNGSTVIASPRVIFRAQKQNGEPNRGTNARGSL